MPTQDKLTATYNLTKQKYFYDPLTQKPLYSLHGNVILRMRDADSIVPLTDKILCHLMNIPLLSDRDPKRQIKAIQNHPLLKNFFSNRVVSDLYKIVEQMSLSLSYGKGKQPVFITDCLTLGYRLMCSDVTAIVAACLDQWNVPLRIGVGYGKNVKFEYENRQYHYFLDNEPGFGPTQHCWIEIYLNEEWVVFDPTIYFNKVKSHPSEGLLDKYREIALQKHSESILYQWVIPDYMKTPYAKNFKKTLLMMCGEMDNAAALVHLLTQTSDVLHVHRVILKTDQHIKAENQALQHVLQYCQEHHRPFVYTESIIDRAASDGSCENDLYHIMYAAAQVIKLDHREHHFDRVVCGNCESGVCEMATTQNSGLKYMPRNGWN